MTWHLSFNTAKYSAMTSVLQFGITNKTSFISTGLIKTDIHSFVKGFISSKQCIQWNKLKKSLRLTVQLKSNSLAEIHRHVISEHKRERTLERLQDKLKSVNHCMDVFWFIVHKAYVYSS